MALKRILHYDVMLTRSGWSLWMTVDGSTEKVPWSGANDGSLATMLAVISDPRARYHTVQRHISLDTEQTASFHDELA